MMIVVLIFAVRSLKHRYGKCYNKYGPLTIIVLSVILIMAEPTRHVVSDYNIWFVIIFETCTYLNTLILIMRRAWKVAPMELPLIL